MTKPPRIDISEEALWAAHVLRKKYGADTRKEIVSDILLAVLNKKEGKLIREYLQRKYGMANLDGIISKV